MPARASASSSRWPAGPTNGFPARSSRSPGCSPTNMTVAPTAPSPNTVWVPVSCRSQAWHDAAASLRLGRLSWSGMSWRAGDSARRRLIEGQGQGELASLPRTGDGDDVAPVQAGQLAGQVEAEPGPGHVGHGLGGQTAEPHEEPRHVLGRDPDPRVAHRQKHHVLDRGEVTVNVATAG